MIVVDWAAGVNTRVLRDTTWDEPVCTIADKTRSGKMKVRGAYELQAKTFNVVMHFTLTEKASFLAWFRNDLRGGALAFRFPKIDAESDVPNNYGFYRFVPSSRISWSNEGGLIMRAEMEWMEVVC